MGDPKPATSGRRRGTEILASRRARVRVAAQYSLALLLAVAAIGITARGQAYQTNWEPNRYKIKCTHGSCLTALYPKIISDLEMIVAKYKADQWQAQEKFGPVEGTGAAAQTVVTDTDQDRYAWTSTDRSDCKTATVSFGTKIAEIKNRPHWLYYFPAHEMFHVTQHTYPAFNTCQEERYGWVGESLATAVGLDFARTRFPTKFPITDSTDATDVIPGQTLLDANLNPFSVTFNTMEREILSDAGGREYYVPLNLIQPKEDGSENNSGDPRHYRTSGLWRHIAEVYHGGSYSFVQKYLQRKAIKNDWLDWAHRNVEPDLRAPLARVFALYMADVANWYRPGRPAMAFPEAEWHKILYDGCLKYTISPGNPVAKVDIVMNRSSARCIQITAEGLKPGDRKAINSGVFSPQHKVNALDALQLSLASSTDSVNLDCSEALRASVRETRLLARDKCVFGPGPGTIVINQQPHAGLVWNVVPQETSGGSTFTNTYILSRMTANPTDDPDLSDGGPQLKISAVFILDSPDAMINNQKLGFGPSTIVGRFFNGSHANFLPAAFAQDDPTAAIFGQKLNTVRIVGHLNGSPANYAQETVPRFGKDGKQAIATVTPGAVMPSSPVLDLFGANPSLSQGKPANTAGIWMLRWTAVKVEEDGMYQQSLVDMGPGRDYIAAFPYDVNGKEPRPLQIGDKGQFKAMVTAKVGFRNIVSRTPATITVDEYSLFVLRARIEGTFCEMAASGASDECVNPQPFSATMVKAFAGLHDPRSRFIIEDTPATQQYARFRQALMNEALDQSSTDTPMPPDLEKGPSSEGAVIVKNCTCSCDDRAYLQRLGKYIDSGNKLSATGMKQLQERMRCMATCTPHYMTCRKK